MDSREALIGWASTLPAEAPVAVPAGMLLDLLGVRPVMDGSLVPLAVWCEATGVSPRKARRLIRSGKIGGCREVPGRPGNYLVPKEALPPVTVPEPQLTASTLDLPTYAEARRAKR
jgi:hypothetical protein